MYQIEELLEEVQALFDVGDFRQARDVLARASKDEALSSVSRAYVLHLLGRTCYYQGAAPDARRYFLEALKLNPHDAYSMLYLARIAEGEGDSVAALRLHAAAYEAAVPLCYLAGDMQRLARTLVCSDSVVQSLDARVHHVGMKSSRPLFSILVLCYNKAEYTLRCLEALFRNTDLPPFEVIVVDNASVDVTPAMLEAYSSRITFVRGEANRGFVGGNNFAAQYARGDYIVFLNNDTEVQQGWLTEMHRCFERHPRVGAVGAMLIYPNGVLQEAGGVIFNDASGWNYGRGCAPQLSRFQFTREVDYCSGAALAVRADVFRRLGGFDERFAPAYYEDTDLCFAVRRLGYKVLYCPNAKVIHHEGVTAGTDLSSGFKKYQMINAPKFREKWKDELALQYPCDEKLCYLFSNRNRGKRILIIDDLPPLPDRAAGSLRMYHTVKQMLALGYQVTYVHLATRGLNEAAKRHMADLRAAGVELIWFEYETWWDIRSTPAARVVHERLIASLELPLRKLDLVYICFWHIAGYFIDELRKADPSVPIVVDSMDVHFLREERRVALLNESREKETVRQIKAQELAVYAKADAVTTVTEADRDVLRRDLPEKAIFIMTDVHDPQTARTSFEERRDFLFVGNFNHNPNEDAVVWFVSEIFPLIKKKLPEAQFWIVGNNPTPAVKAIASRDVIVTGWVPETRPYLERCRVAVAPLRFGAGNKGKVGEALAHGIPLVTTTIGAEGMNIAHAVHAFVADDPKEFALLAVELYTNHQLWERFSSEGKKLIVQQYSSALMRKRIEYLMSFPSQRAFRSYRALRYATPPRASIVVLTHNQYTYTRQCLESIRLHTRISHETIVVDNASTDGTSKRIEQDFPEVRVIANERNLGFPAGVNQGINAALGDVVVLLNNDTVVTEGWLERLVEVAEADGAIGIVGTMSNYASGVQRDPEATYRSIPEMHRYAQNVRKQKRGSLLNFPRVAFVCALITRKLLDTIGGLDERFSPGNYEDDDYCLRAAIASFKTVVAQDVFIHHFGSKSFLAEGQDTYHARLHTNRMAFVEKWGVDPDTLWTSIGQVDIRKRSLNVPLHHDTFVQYFSRAQLLIEEQDWIPALKALEECLRVFHQSPREPSSIEFTDVLDLAGHVSLALGLIEKARRYFEQELHITPTSSRACAGLGEVFLQAQLAQEAKTMFEYAVLNDWNNEYARQGLAKANTLLGLLEVHNSLVKSDREVTEEIIEANVEKA